MGRFSRKDQDEQETLLEEMTAMHDGEKLTDLHPEMTIEHLATRAKQIVEFQEDLRQGKV